MSSHSDQISDALEELGEEDYDEDDLRLLRVKFMSDHGN
jgi:ATP-dependent DNA helicase RecQ